MRIIARDIYLDQFHRRPASISHKIILNSQPALLVVHHPRQLLHLLLPQTQQTHHAVYQFLRIATLVQHFLVRQLRDLPQIDRIVELVVYLEKWRKLMKLKVVGGFELLDLAERKGRSCRRAIAVILNGSLITPETLRSSCCQSLTVTKYLPSKIALQTVSKRDAFMLQWYVYGLSNLPAMAMPSGADGHRRTTKLDWACCSMISSMNAVAKTTCEQQWGSRVLLLLAQSIRMWN